MFTCLPNLWDPINNSVTNIISALILGKEPKGHSMQISYRCHGQPMLAA